MLEPLAPLWPRTPGHGGEWSCCPFFLIREPPLEPHFIAKNRSWRSVWQKGICWAGRKALLRGRNGESKTCFDSGETWQDAFNSEFHYGLCDLDAKGSSKAVIFLDWVKSGAPWRSRLWIGVDPVNLIGWMEWIWSCGALGAPIL